MAKVRYDDTKQAVERLLGKPDDIRRAPDPVLVAGDEVWRYGTNGHLALPTLGEACFRRGRVVWVAGGYGAETVPSPRVITEEDLWAGMRALHPGPEAAGYNDPLQLIRAINFLQPTGKEKALAIIGEYARIAGPEVDQTWLFLLLRTLFEIPTPPGYMPELFIGAMVPPPPKDRKRIPRFPVVIVDDIPFSLLWGVALAGVPEPASRHVEYFREHGTLRSNHLRPPDDPYLSFKKLLASGEWAYMSETAGDARNLSGYEGHTLLQVLALARTAYDPPEAREPFAYPKPEHYARYHAAFIATGARWDDRLQMYVRRDGSHGPVGHLANIYNR
jgi:hypothetical protein